MSVYVNMVLMKSKANPSVEFNLTHIKNITKEPKIIQLDYNGKKINIKR
ncbi:hypothetical protein [Fusobacterium sp. PH5-29]